MKKRAQMQAGLRHPHPQAAAQTAQTMLLVQLLLLLPLACQIAKVCVSVSA